MSVDWDALVLAPLHAIFGETIFYQPIDAEIFRLTDAVFDRAYIQVGTDAGGVPVTALHTIVGIRLASCPPRFVPKDGDRVTRDDVTWQVVDEQPDGKGNVVLVLGALPQ
jgi:hypothetical protein